ncbi:MAG TPA: histidine kinase [Actinomycetota bacterium]|nr:histidine kinase [Actinomycetota bacterium]
MDRPARSRPSRWPWVALGVFFSLAITGMIGVAVNGESLAEQIPNVIAFTLFGIVGALLLSRLPGNRVGGLLLFGAAVTAGSFAAGELMTYLVRGGNTDGPAGVAMGLVSSLGWLVGIFPVILFLPLLFPDGHLPSRRWLPFAWLCAAVLVFLGVLLLFGQDTLAGSSEDAVIANPFFMPGLAGLEIPDVVFAVSLIGLLLGSVVSLVLRFRRSTGIERQQIKWVALAIAFLASSFILSTIASAIGLNEELIDSIVSGIAFITLPVAVAVAVLQYHLYDLDVVVKKALVAGALVLLVIAAYAAVVGLLGVITSGNESSGSVFIVALLLGLAFRPVTRFARRIADRVVYGRRATPYEVLTEFSERVGESYATEDVLGRMAQILGQATGAGSARVWLRLGPELRPAASWPTDAKPVAAAFVASEALPTIEGETVVEVRDRGELLGALSVAMPPSDPMNPSKERLVRDLASQAGLVLRNVRLVEELRGSQRRLVRAQDQERRRLERNIHDGAQQQLVALSVKTRLARDLTARDPARAAEMLTQIDTEIQSAVDDLRDLARGIYPPLLIDEGLGAALDAQARRSPVPTTVRADGLRRYAPEVEAAVYFSCLEALQNVAKYAEASSATVILAQSNGHLTFEVMDDGRGFDPTAERTGTGLQGIADRLGALHGEVTIRSEPGAGTRVRGRIEVGA